MSKAHVAVLMVAKADGYPDPVIIEDKESAVRLSEAERSGINRLYSEIDKNNVAAVYVYELSRLSRRPDVIYSVRDRLMAAGVQLVVVNPSIRLLRPDGRMDENANVLIGIFCAMAENEGYIRKARLATITSCSPTPSSERKPAPLWNRPSAI